MIDSTNIRIIADNIRHLFKKVNSIEPGTVVEGNPSGSGFNTLLTKIKIGSSKYKLPNQVNANPEGEATSNLTKLEIGSAIFGIPVGGIEYSTTEQKIGKWTDDSDLYSKTYIVDSNITNNGTTSIDSDMLPSMFKGAFGYIECNSGAEIWPMMFYLDSNNFVRYMISSAGINVEIKDSYHIPNKIVITVFYTKNSEEE